MQQLYFSGIAALLLTTLHVLFPLLDKKYQRYSSSWVPFTGGIAIGYVFIYLLPKLSDFTQIIIAQNPDDWEFLHYRLYLVALAALVIYLITDLFYINDKEEQPWRLKIHAAGFCSYSLLIGIVIANLPRSGVAPIFIISVFALGPHLLGLDHQLRHWHASIFDRYFRWLLALSILTGWIIGAIWELPKSALWYFTAFLAGGIISNVMIEELPDQKNKMLPFIFGVVVFVLIAITVRSLPKAAI